MSETNAKEQAPGASDGRSDGRSPLDRRRNARLRTLVDEMLESIRVAQRNDTWTPEERERAEADLARIMAQVRRAAVEGDL